MTAHSSCHIITVSHPIRTVPVFNSWPACKSPFTCGTHTAQCCVFLWWKCIHNKWYKNENMPCSLVSMSVQYVRCKQELTAKVSFLHKRLTTWPTAATTRASWCKLGTALQMKTKCVTLFQPCFTPTKNEFVRRRQVGLLNTLCTHTIRYLVL
jgi:hypothetical protein